MNGVRYLCRRCNQMFPMQRGFALDTTRMSGICMPCYYCTGSIPCSGCGNGVAVDDIFYLGGEALFCISCIDGGPTELPQWVIING